MIPGLGRSAGEGVGYPLQYSGLESSMDYHKESDMNELLSLSQIQRADYKLIRRFFTAESSRSLTPLLFKSPLYDKRTDSI